MYNVVLTVTQLFVHAVNLETGLEYYWSREKFYNRKCVMQELFNRFDDDDDDFKGDIEEVNHLIFTRKESSLNCPLFWILNTKAAKFCQLFSIKNDFLLEHFELGTNKASIALLIV